MRGKFEQEVMAKWVSEDPTPLPVLSKEWTTRFPARGWGVCWWGLWDPEKEQFRSTPLDKTKCRIYPGDRAVQVTVEGVVKIAFHEAHVHDHQLGVLNESTGRRHLLPRIIEGAKAPKPEAEQEEWDDPFPFPAEKEEEKEADMANNESPSEGDAPYSYEYTKITPEMAEEFLEHNTNNRPIRQSHVDRIAEDMANGDWHDHGEPIRFADDGTLLDAQHRLAGVVQSGVAVWMMVIRGLPRESQEHIDTGIQRSLADTLKMRGEFNSISLAAAIKRVAKWEDGLRKTVCTGVDTPSRARLLRCYNEHPEIKESVTVGGQVNYHLGFSTATLALAHWIFNRIDAEDCKGFFDSLSKPVGLEETDGVYHLIKIASRKRASNTKDYTQTEILALIIKAWNAYRSGTPIRALGWRSGGAQKENFPEPK